MKQNDNYEPASSQIDRLIDRDWQAAFNSLEADDLAKLARQLTDSPSMILETQQRLLAIAYFLSPQAGTEDAVQQFLGAAHRLSVINSAWRSADKAEELCLNLKKELGL